MKVTYKAANTLNRAMTGRTCLGWIMSKSLDLGQV